MQQNELPGLDADHAIEVENIELVEPLYSELEKTDEAKFSRLAHSVDEVCYSHRKTNGSQGVLEHPSGAKFSVPQLANVTGKNKGKLRAVGNATRLDKKPCSPMESCNLNAVGPKGKKLRPAQIGAIYALLSHWSLSGDTATVVLPTGTGKTETMLAASIADKAEKTLVIVPSIDLKNQISNKFASWGMLRELGVIPEESLNPAVLVLKKTVSKQYTLDLIQRADVIVTTPALLARAEPQILAQVSALVSHIYFDEAHHITASEWDSLKKKFSRSKVVQFTATPYRNDRKPIEGEIVYNYPVARAIDDGCFSQISLVAVSERHPKRKHKAIADAAMARLTEDRENGWLRHKMMVRAKDKPEAHFLYKSYQAWYPDERIVLVLSGMLRRSEIINEIKQGKYDIVVCVDMLKEGFDYPDFKIAAVHGMHKSLSVLLQFIGRFTRTQDGLGNASFVVNYADESMSTELEDLFQEHDTGWEDVISEIADAKKEKAQSLLAFLQGCKPLAGFDSPDVQLNPKLVYPALSCVCFRAKKIDWDRFQDAFNLNVHALSHPYFNVEENVFYFAVQKREKVKWARTEMMRDQTWNLIVVHHDAKNELLYVGYSDRNYNVGSLVEALTGQKAQNIDGDDVFRTFDSINRLSIVHAGIFKPANHLHRYSRLSGADVTTELSQWKQGKRTKKSDFVGVGYRDGFPVSVGASVKGKVWSPARRADLKEWKAWCLDMGRMLTDDTIVSNILLENSAEKTQLETYPPDLIVLATDWSEQLYNDFHKLTLESRDASLLLMECALQFLGTNGNIAEFKIVASDAEIPFQVKLGGEHGHSIVGLDGPEYRIEGWKSDPMPLKKFFEEQPPTLFLLNGQTIAGCIYTDYGETGSVQIPEERIEVLDWAGVDLPVESMYKSDVYRENSIQEYMMSNLSERGADIVFNDDNSGEISDVIAVFATDDLIRFELVHCKYSKPKVGDRLSDLYEVCGQAIVSLRHKWRPEELLRHMLRRNATGVLQGKRFFTGNEDDVARITKALKYTNVEFEFAIAQPGVGASTLSDDQKNFLGSIYAMVVEMTETKLRCYFNEKPTQI